MAQTLPTPHGTSASIKLVNHATFIKDFAALGLPIEERIRLVEELRRSFGLVLIGSPIYEGANTTAYSIMDFLLRAQREVVSVESPVQWVVDGAWQVEARHDGMSEALRAAVAVHPDVVILFSVPDAATALLATQLAASLLVVVVVTAQSAALGVQGFLETGVPRHLLAGTLALSLCQRLVRRICPICREVAPPPGALIPLGSHQEPEALRFFRGRGCPTCNRLGYRGRRAVFELLTGTPEVVAGITRGATVEEIDGAARRGGLKTLRERTLDLVSEGSTTYDEFARLRL